VLIRLWVTGGGAPSIAALKIWAYQIGEMYVTAQLRKKFSFHYIMYKECLEKDALNIKGNLIHLKF
jgi:hypothetical protein